MRPGPHHVLPRISSITWIHCQFGEDAQPNILCRSMRVCVPLHGRHPASPEGAHRMPHNSRFAVLTATALAACVWTMGVGTASASARGWDGGGAATGPVAGSVTNPVGGPNAGGTTPPLPNTP